MADGILGALNRLRRIENERKIENLVKDDPDSGLMRSLRCVTLLKKIFLSQNSHQISVDNEPEKYISWHSII